MPATRRGKFKVRNVALGLGAAFASALILYVIHLDRIVTRQFEGRRWTVPAQVFAAPLELYAGLPWSAQDVETELARLQYRPATELERPGTYRLRGGRIEIAARSARFADGTRAAQQVVLAVGPSGVQSVRDARGRDIGVFRLDPLLIGSIFPIHGEDRIVVSPAEVPPLLPAALIAVEDHDFERHPGIDPRAILRALWVDLRAGEVEQGGSTLTQQLVKSYFLDNERTFGRKAREAIMALALESHFDKADLMNAYINEIYLGQDGDRAIHGFGLASRFYFGKPLGELEPDEIALLVALVRGPSLYDPRAHPQRAKQRRDLVLATLADRHVMTREQARAATARPLGVIDRGSAGYYPAYLDLVRRSLRHDYQEKDLTEEGLRVYTSFEPRVQAAAERILERQLSQLERTRRRRGAELEGAVVVTAPQSGEVLAIVGGRHAAYSGFNRALDAHRPIGSLVKPFVYLAAIESGRYHAASVVQDAPVEVRLAADAWWRPRNYGGVANGPVPLVRALAESMNLATVNLGLDVGLPQVAETIRRVAPGHDPQENPSLLLGALELSPFDVADMYDTLANDGFRTPLHSVRAVVSPDGTILKAFPLEIAPVVEPAAAYQVDRMLTQVIDRGTARAARAQLPADLVLAGKTGTSSDLRDSWFAGFSGSHLSVVWLGYDDNEPTGLTGSSGALGVWSQLMASLHTSSWQTPMPDSLTDVSIDYATGLRVEPGCAVDAIAVAVPITSELREDRGCGNPLLSGLRAIERGADWLRGQLD